MTLRHPSPDGGERATVRTRQETHPLMANFSASDVKRLRDLTGAGFMD